MAKLKSFVTQVGFYELAVAAPSMKAALAAWGMTHNAFHQGFARQTQDAAIVAATSAEPNTVLRRPLGTKGAFQKTPDAPKAPKAKPGKKPAKKPDTAAIRKAEQALKDAQATHQDRLAELTDARDAVGEKIRDENKDWKNRQADLQAALKNSRQRK